jgi:hypothetical protein
MTARVRRGLGQAGEKINGLLREALTIAQANNLTMFTLWTLLQTVYVLVVDERHLLQAEVIGHLLTHQLTYRSQINVNAMLDALRLQVEVAALDAALERGKLLNLDEVVARLLTELV